MNVRALTIPIPLLMLLYGVARWFDGRDGEYGPGVAWNIGHVAFLAAFVGFGALTVHFWRSSARPHPAAIVAYVASLVGVALFLWVILTDLIPALDERASLPDPVMAVGPLIFIVGFVASLALHTRRVGMPGWIAPPLLTLAALIVVGANLDLLPLTAVLLAAALVPVGLREDEPRVSGFAGGRRTVLALLLATWFGASLSAGALGVFETEGPPIALALSGTLPPVLLTVGLLTSVSLRNWLATWDLPFLTMLQTWRLAGIAFIALSATGDLPSTFAFPAGYGDILVAVIAPIVAVAVAGTWRHWRALFYSFTAFGILDLLTALALGALHSPSDIGVLASTIDTTQVALLPMSLIPTFGVPLTLCLHVVSLYVAGVDHHASRVLRARDVQARGAGPDRGYGLELPRP